MNVDKATDEELRELLQKHMDHPDYFGVKPNLNDWRRDELQKAVRDILSLMTMKVTTFQNAGVDIWRKMPRK